MIQGSAREALLDSYGAERRAIALANTALSVANWEEALRVPRALGLDPAAARLLHRAVSSSAASLLPSGGIPPPLHTTQCSPLAYFRGCWHGTIQDCAIRPMSQSIKSECIPPAIRADGSFACGHHLRQVPFAFACALTKGGAV